MNRNMAIVVTAVCAAVVCYSVYKTMSMTQVAPLKQLVLGMTDLTHTQMDRTRPDLTHTHMDRTRPGIAWRNLTRDCRALYRSESLEKLSEIYAREKPSFDIVFNAARRGIKLEGHTGQISSQLKLYFHLVNDSGAKTVCETGFNAGHSALMWLSSSPHVHLYSFDIGLHAYTKPMVAYLTKAFPGRVHITLGNSLQTLPNFTRDNNVQCDVLSVDGGHSVKVALADLVNMAPLANPEGHTLIIDDFTRPGNTRHGTGKAWRQTLKEGIIEEIYTCFFSGGMRGGTGLAVGRYRNPITKP